jgi:hypothetical protein
MPGHATGDRMDGELDLGAALGEPRRAPSSRAAGGRSPRPGPWRNLWARVIRGISFHRQRGHAALGKTEQGRGRRQRAAEPDDDCIGGDDVVAIDRLHSHEDLGSEHLVALSYDLGSLVAIGAVREVRGLARARLDDHLDPASVQALVPLAIALLPQLAIFTILLWPSLSSLSRRPTLLGYY